MYYHRPVVSVFVLLMIIALCIPPSVPAQTTYTNTIKQATAFIESAMTNYNIPGLSLVLVDGTNSVWAEGFGYADVETQIPVDTNTVFMIGSVSKTLASIVTMQEVDQGHIDLDVSITNYLPEFSLLPRYTQEDITVRNMLNHHSGLPGDIYNGAVAGHAYWGGYSDWLLAYLTSDYLVYPPDTIASYCNSGFNLAAAIIGRVASTTFVEYAQTYLFNALDMQSSSFLHDNPAITDRLATGYVGGQPFPVMIFNMVATGGALSTPSDMANVIGMFLGEGVYNGQQILSTNAVYEMSQALHAELDIDAYFQPGLGWDTVRDLAMQYAGRTWAKDGSTGTFGSLLSILPDQQLGCFVVMNTAHECKYPIVREILKLAVEEKSGLPPPPAPLSPDRTITNRPYAELQAYEGIYVTRSDYEQIEAETNGTLKWLQNGYSQPSWLTNLQPLVNGCFAVPGYTNMQISFTNIGGYDLLVQHGSSGSERDEMIYADYVTNIHSVKYDPAVISSAWMERTGTLWVCDNLYDDDYNLLSPEIWMAQLVVHSNLLFLESTGGRMVIAPTNDNLAFVPGLGNRLGGAVRCYTTNDVDHLQFSGYRGRSITNIPLVQMEGETNSTLSFHEMGWYRFDVPTNGIYSFTQAGVDHMRIMILNDAMSVALTDSFDEVVSVSVSNGVALYILMMPTNTASTYALRTEYPLMVDALSVSNGDVVVDWQSLPGSNYTLSAAYFLRGNEQFFVVETNLSASSMKTSVSEAEECIPDVFYRIEGAEPVSQCGRVLMLTDMHFSPYENSNVVAQLVSSDYSGWPAIFSAYTNKAWFSTNEMGYHVTDWQLYQSALNAAKKALPRPDAILLTGDFLPHANRQYYEMYTGDTSDVGYRSFVYKTFGFVSGQIAERWPGVPLLPVLGNNDSYIDDYEITPEGAFLSDAAGLLYTNGVSNICTLAQFQPDFAKGGYYHVSLNDDTDVIGLCGQFISSRYTNQSGFALYDPATNELGFLEQQLDEVERATNHAWILIHIVPGVDAYKTKTNFESGNTNEVTELWKNPYLDRFVSIVSAYTNCIKGIFCGHTHMREYRLLSDAASNAVEAIHVVPAIDYGFGNDPSFQMMVYDRKDLDVNAVITLTLPRSTCAGQSGPVVWDRIASYNRTFSLPDYSPGTMEALYQGLTNQRAWATSYWNQFETGSGLNLINVSNWPIYSTTIRWLDATNYLRHYRP